MALAAEVPALNERRPTTAETNYGAEDVYDENGLFTGWLLRIRANLRGDFNCTISTFRLIRGREAPIDNSDCTQVEDYPILNRVQLEFFLPFREFKTVKRGLTLTVSSGLQGESIQIPSPYSRLLPLVLTAPEVVTQADRTYKISGWQLGGITEVLVNDVKAPITTRGKDVLAFQLPANGVKAPCIVKFKYAGETTYALVGADAMILQPCPPPKTPVAKESIVPKPPTPEKPAATATPKHDVKPLERVPPP
jgi:hypothetical protein